jgi:peptidoglycan/xylan/chitin deacetylase (PgdA/CDA1 family)
MGISTETFWGLIRFLQSHYRIVSLSEAVALLRSGVVDSPTVVLTFDDGYADNFVSLRAVAQEAEVPVTLFMATSPVDQHLEFEHDLAHADRGLLPLTWAQARYWSRRGAEFGSHTRTHFDCGATHQERLTTEIVSSRDELERRLEQPVKFFAFPFGQTGNMSDEAVAIAADTYEHFVSCFGGENLPGESRDAPQHLLRKNFYPDPWELELELQSIFDQVEKIKRKIRWKFMTAFDSSKTLKFESKR